MLRKEFNQARGVTFTYRGAEAPEHQNRSIERSNRRDILHERAALIQWKGRPGYINQMLKIAT